MSYQALLFCPDEKTARLVTQVLSELDFSVEPSNEPFTAVKRLMAQHFDAVVVDCDNEQNATLLFKSARNSASNQSSLAVAVVEGQAGVAKAFRIGANLVLTKPINVDQAKGTLRVARGLLKKSDANKAPVASALTANAPASPSFSPAAQSRTAPSAPVARPEAAAQRPTFVPSSPKTVQAVAARTAPAAHASDANQNVHESAVLDLPPDLAPSGKSPVVRPAAKEYAWQPVSKPSGPMASAFKQAAEEESAPAVDEISDAAESADLVEAVADSEASSVLEPPSSSAPVFAASSAASAPAPAKQKVAVKAVTRPVVKPVAKPPIEKPEASKPAVNKLAISAPPVEEPAPAPAVAANHPLPVAAKSGSHIGIIVVVVLLVLGAAGYFGWTKLHTNQSAAVPVQQASSAKPAAQAPVISPAPLPSAEQKPSAGSAISPATHVEAAPLSAKPQTEPDKKSAKATTSVKDEDREADDSGPAEPQPMIVKSGGSKPAHAAEPSAPVVAPDPMLAAVGSSDKSIAGIASTGLNVAHPVEQSLRVSQGVLQGRLIKKVQPTYPSTALRLRIQGIVQLAATITKNGDVANLKQLSGDPNLGHAAEDAVRQWKYKPYLLDGRPVEIQTQISVEFKLPS